MNQVNNALHTEIIFQECSKKTLGNGDHGEWWKDQELGCQADKFETLQHDMMDFPGGPVA